MVSERKPSSTRARSKWVGYSLNILSACNALRLLSIPAGSNLFMGFEAFLILAISGLGLLIGIPLAFRDLRKGCSKIDVSLGVALSLTPLPLYFLLVGLIANAKQFTFY